MRRISMFGIALLLVAGCKPVAQSPAVAHERGGQLVGNAAAGGTAAAGGGTGLADTGVDPGLKGLAAADRVELRGAISSYLADKPAHAGLWVQDLRTGATFGYREHSRFITASVAKVNILTGLLLERQAEHRDLTSYERDLATKMIRNSDNSAADELYADAGQSAGLSRIDSRLGLKHTAPYPVVWGATHTCPYDQVRLLHLLTDADSPLTPAHRQFVLSLMQTVSRDQDWGIRAAANDDETVAVKNGWVPMHTMGTGWEINSIGRITGPEHDFLIAVFTAGWPDMQSGVRAVEHIADLTVSTLRHTS